MRQGKREGKEEGNQVVKLNEKGKGKEIRWGGGGAGWEVVCVCDGARFKYKFVEVMVYF
jgi:hypothetical protein